MLKRVVVAFLAACALSGCSTIGDPAVVAGSLSAARTTLQMWLDVAVPTLSDEELQGRRKIMDYVVPATTEIGTAAVAYKASLDAEAQRRGLPAVRAVKP